MIKIKKSKKIFQIASTLSFIGYELTAHPDIQEKLFDEIKDMNDSLGGKTINYDQLQGLKYLDQVVCETLRLFPAAPVSIFFYHFISCFLIT